MDFNTQIIDEFRANEGRVGGPFEGAPLLLLHTTGARTGNKYISPVMYLADQGRYLVFASKAGADTNPAWYHNLKAHPETNIEVGARTVKVRAEELHGEERDTFYDQQATLYPGFREYEQKTSRVIPVVALIPVD